METSLNDIGQLLLRRRKEKGLTQAEAGALIGIQKSMVSKIESGASTNFDTGLYIESPAYICTLLISELCNGRFSLDA